MFTGQSTPEANRLAVPLLCSAALFQCRRLTTGKVGSGTQSVMSLVVGLSLPSIYFCGSRSLPKPKPSRPCLKRSRPGQSSALSRYPGSFSALHPSPRQVGKVLSIRWACGRRIFSVTNRFGRLANQRPREQFDTSIDLASSVSG